MRFRWKLLAGLGVFGVLVLLWFARFALDYVDPGSVAHVSMQYDLKLYGSAIYEYHSKTGRWPSQLEDLAQTSLAARRSVWRQATTPLVFLWPKDLKPDPKDNAGVLLIYHQGGLFNQLGRVWVCWGDLRTEHMVEKELRARLAK